MGRVQQGRRRGIEHKGEGNLTGGKWEGHKGEDRRESVNRSKGREKEEEEEGRRPQLMSSQADSDYESVTRHTFASDPNKPF